MQEQQYLHVNWKDGQSIKEGHFKAQENAFIYQLAQSTGSLLNPFNYGLLPDPGNREAGVKILLLMDNQQVQLSIRQCRAITAGGYYLEFNEETAIYGNDLSA